MRKKVTILALKTALSAACLSLVIAAAPQAALAADLGFTVGSFIKTFNDYAEAMHVQSIDPATAKKKSDQKTSITFTPSKYYSVLLFTENGSDTVSSGMMIAAGDGTQLSGMTMLFGLIAFASAMTPELRGDANNSMLKAIGLDIEGPKIADGQRREFSSPNASLTSQFTSSTGVMLAVDPANI